MRFRFLTMVQMILKQITYGRSQTTEYGNLRELVQKYVGAKGKFSKDLKSFAEKVGSVPLTDDQKFKDLLKNSGKQDVVMKNTQDTFFDERYFKPAMKWAKDNGFILPLSALVIYDSFIHSGGILWVIRSMFSENPPNLGGNEIEWTTAYVNARHNWAGKSSAPGCSKNRLSNAMFQRRNRARKLDAENYCRSRLTASMFHNRQKFAREQGRKIFKFRCFPKLPKLSVCHSNHQAENQA